MMAAMTFSPSQSPAPQSGERAAIPAATEAALWALSNGRCYAPACPQPVVMEVRPGIYKKNAQVAHIYGVRKGAPRYEEGRPDRDAFINLLLLCLPHHGEVDDKKTGERLYPPRLLHKWKKEHEGSNAQALAALGTVTEEQLGDLLTSVFTPPLARLEAIADRLERTGTVNAQTVLELKQVIDVLAVTGAGIDARSVNALAYAAEVLGTGSFNRSAQQLSYAAETLPHAAREMARAAATMSQFR